MNTGIDLNKGISQLAEISIDISQWMLNKNQTCLMARLQAVTASEIDPELGKAWRNRMVVRSRLRKYASGH